MKKSLLLMLLLSAAGGYSQVRDYTFTQKTGVYTEISGGTILGDEFSDAQRFVDPGELSGSTATTGAGLPIGFNFTFNGYVYDRFAVSTDGWISLGSSLATPFAVNCAVSNPALPLTSTSTVPPAELSSRISALGRDLQAQPESSLTYKTIGVMPNRTLVIQWKKFKKAGSNGDDFNFQIRLNETTNTVDIIYGDFTHNSSPGATYQVGLRAEPNVPASNYSNRQSSIGWSNTIAGTASNSYIPMTETSVPDSGLTFTWTPPQCGTAKGLAVSSITSKGAKLDWGSYSNNASSYGYIVSKNSAMPSTTETGTDTANPTATVTDLDSNTTYYVFLRANCTEGTAKWVLGGTFKTACEEVSTIFEDFDSYNGNTGTVMPDCWSAAGDGYTHISNPSSSPMTKPNYLNMHSTGGDKPTLSYAIMPTVSNLSAGTHRLRFNAFSSTWTDRTLDVGYFAVPGDLTSFVNLQTVNLPGVAAANAKSFVVVPTGVPAGIKNLAFRNKGIPTGETRALIDDVIYEPIPACDDVKNIVLSELKDKTVKLSWTKGAAETQWQYAVCPSTTLNPNTVQPQTHTGATPSLTVTGLNPSTSYRIWIRSKCGDSDFGSWIATEVFTTTCEVAADTQFMENFDAGTTALPSCWAKVGNSGNVLVNSVFGGSVSGTHALYLQSTTASNIATVALPPLGNATIGSHRLKFKAKAGIKDAQVAIGYMVDMADPTTFVSLETVTITSTSVFDSYMFALGSAPQSAYLAMRNLGTPATYVYIDDVVWEKIPFCPDVTAVETTSVTSSTAKLVWTAGGQENDWQYARGTANTKDPFSLPTVDVSDPTATISNLDPATTYKVWVRSKCSDTNLGAWMGPVVFGTSCEEVTSFTQNFDGSTAWPACWSKVNSAGTSGVQATSAPSSPNALYLTASSNTGPSVGAMPQVSNATSGTHRLRFKVKFSSINGKLEVGYLLNYGNPASFVPVETFAATQNATFEIKSVNMGTEPETGFLAFRNPGPMSSTTTTYIDDVVWEKIPTCADVTNVLLTNISSSTVNAAWTKGGSESKWEYAITTGATNNPDDLTAVEVSSTSTIIDKLAPATTHKLWIRSKCATNDEGTWIGPYQFTTACEGVSEWSQNFDAVTSLPSCWNKVGTGGMALVNTLADAPSKSKVLALYSTTGIGQSIVSMPTISISSAANHQLTFKYRTNTLGSVLEVGYLTGAGDPLSFVPIKSITANSTTTFQTATVSLGASPISGILAFRNTAAADGYIYIDDVNWNVMPTAVPDCAAAITAVPNNSCGNYATVISWSESANADAYKLTVGTSPGASDLLNAQDVIGLSYSVFGNPNTTYYYTVKPYNNVGPATGCVEQTFKTIADKCYCASVPTTKDGTGITKIQIGATNFTNGSVTYFDHTAKAVNLEANAQANVHVTYNTNTYVYNENVWIDFNDNFEFEISELVFTGTTVTVTPNTLNSSFMMPANAPLGLHRMRIGASYIGNSVQNDPCYSDKGGITLDFNVNVVSPVINDSPAGAIALTVGSNFSKNATTGSNVDATGSTVETNPACGGYSGMDVWYKAVVPASGNVVFEINTAAGGLTNTAAAVYSGTPGALTLIECNDSGSTDGDDHPRIGLTGKTANDVIYLRVWENGGDATGTFKVSAYEAVLGKDAFTINNFAYFPNPVKDALNLSLDQVIDQISVLNLLGQAVISQTIKANQARIDLSQLTAGTYLVKVTSGNQLKTIKVIKE